ncbi:FadR/GntR family transcriptional regulator [Streptomyces phaeochromogenes]
MLRPITPATAFEETVERLSNSILLGVLPPGSQLPPERELAVRLGVSRATLRRALAALQEAALIHARAGRGGGTFISEWQENERPILPDDWTAVLDLRASLEMGAAMLATTRAGEADLNELDELITQMYEAEGPDTYRRLDVSFHLKIAEITGSGPLIEAVARAQVELTRLVRLIRRPGEALRVSNEQHAGILTAMRDKDAGKAALAAFYHNESTRHILSALPRS